MEPKIEPIFIKEFNDYLGTLLPGKDENAEKGNYNKEKFEIILSQMNLDLESYYENFKANPLIANKEELEVCHERLASLKQHIIDQTKFNEGWLPGVWNIIYGEDKLHKES